MINIEMFKSQAIEIQSRISSAQQNLLAKMGAIRENYLLVNQVFENLAARERDVGVARVAFQEAVIAMNNRVLASAPRLTISEQTRGNILLKELDHNIRRRQATSPEDNQFLGGGLNSVDGELLGIDNGGDAETLMQMNVEYISLDLKEKEERDSTDIS
jgi:hypothetical protein